MIQTAQTQAQAVVHLLLVEDNPADVRLTQEVIRDSGLPCVLSIARDGEQAMAMLHREGEYAEEHLPQLILLDLNLPRKDGREVLAEIKADAALRAIPVIVLTTSRAQQDILTCYGLHANAYMNKPVDLDDFIDLIKGIQGYWLQKVVLPPAE